MQKFSDIIEHRYFLIVITAVSVLLMLGSLNNGWLLDDHIQRLMMSSEHRLPWQQNNAWDLYRLIPSEEQFVNTAQEMGFSPWWGADNYQATFFRPLSSLTLYIDYMLWPNSAFMAHLHSMLWFVLMCGAAVLLFKRLLPNRLLFHLAAGFYILDDAHIFPVTWVANRNALIATTLSILVLWLHIRRHKDGWRPGTFLAPLMLVLALLAGEFALGILGFLFAHVLFREQGRPRQKIVRLLPYAGVVVAWRLIYVALGYGVWGSDLYVDPLYSPGDFFNALLVRLPVLLNSGLGWLSAEASIIFPQHLWILTLSAFCCLGVYMAALRPILQQNGLAKFFLTGVVLSLIPVCATFAHDRLLLIAGIGIFGLIACFIEPLFQKELSPSMTSTRLQKVIGVYWFTIHGVLNPLATPFKAEVPQLLGQMCDEATLSLPHSIQDNTIVVVAAPDLFSSAFIPLWRHSLGHSVPAHTVALYNGADEITLIRETAQSLVYEVPEGQLGVWTDQLVRRESDLFEVGDVVLRAGVRFQVLKVSDTGNPTRVRATFSTSLDAPGISLWIWAGKTYQPVPVPARGEQISMRVNVFEYLLQ